MISTLEITNFKSVKHLTLDCKRVNVLIGEPNAGKSNILEALGLLSFAYYYFGIALRDFVRFERTSNLFYDENLDEGLQVKFDGDGLDFEFANGAFRGRWQKTGEVLLQGGHGDLNVSIRHGVFAPFKLYRFAVVPFDRPESEFLLPPNGRNLLSLLMAHRSLRSVVNNLLVPFGLKLGLRPQEGKVEIVKHFEDVIISHPYSLLSDTLQRVIFHLSAIMSNKDSVIALEEPESHTFPYYTKYLAETIALDDRGNQFFVTTHNPYFLLPLLEKCPREEIAVFVTYFRDYQTLVKPLTDADLAELSELDVFSNLDRFLD